MVIGVSTFFADHKKVPKAQHVFPKARRIAQGVGKASGWSPMGLVVCGSPPKKEMQNTTLR
jgi:hypothetical protein